MAEVFTIIFESIFNIYDNVIKESFLLETIRIRYILCFNAQIAHPIVKNIWCFAGHLSCVLKIKFSGYSLF